MYAAHFGLKREPFSIAPDPRYLFMSERHREALAHLLYGVRGGGGFVLLTGEIGAGKTTVCRCFLEQVPKRCNVAYIFNPKLNALELLQSVCAEFRITVSGQGNEPPTLKDHVDALNEYLLRTHAEGQNCVLIIDEAQNLSPDVLEQLRLLTNLETNERKLLQIILIGQPELRDMLARPDLEQLAQRVVARYHLAPLGESETSHYIKHRLAVAGMSGLIPFDREARHRIHELTRGVPRRINLLCDRALLGAYASGRQRVDKAIVDKAASEVFDGTRGNTPLSLTRQRVWLAASGLTLAALLVGAAAMWWVGARHGAAPTPANAASPAVASAPTAGNAGSGATGADSAASATATAASGVPFAAASSAVAPISAAATAAVSGVASAAAAGVAAAKAESKASAPSAARNPAASSPARDPAASSPLRRPAASAPAPAAARAASQ